MGEPALIKIKVKLVDVVMVIGLSRFLTRGRTVTEERRALAPLLPP